MKKVLFLLLFFLIGFSFLSTPKTAAAECTKHPPTVDVVPENRNRNGNPGDEKEYSIKVTNKDTGANCPDVKFTLTKEGLPGPNWEGRFTDNTLVIAKQQTKSTTFKLKSPATAREGRKEITLGVKPESRAKKTFNIYYTVGSSPTPTRTPSPTSTPRPSDSLSPTPTPTNCRRTPEMMVTADKPFVRPGGETITYKVKVKNVDISPCPERNMNLTRNLHNDNWTGVWDPDNNINNFSIGQTRTKKLAVTSPEQAPNGTYIVKINLRNNANQVVHIENVSFVIANTAPTPTLSPTCTPRPLCLDSDPGCLMPEDINLCPPSPPPGGGANLFITIGADGLGTTKRIPLGGNKNPDPDSTNLDVFLYSASSNTRAFEVNTTFTYDPTKEKLVGTVSLPSGFSNGVYNFYIIGPQYKLEQLPGSITLTGIDKTIENENFNLIAGDINKTGSSYNNIDPLDYHVLLSCSIYSQDSETCDKDPNYKEYSDLNYDGIVNEDDFTLWLKEVANQEGAKFPDQ